MLITLFMKTSALIYLRFSGFITFTPAGKIQVHLHNSSPPPLFVSQIPSPQTTHPASPNPRQSGRLPWGKVTSNRGATLADSINNMVGEPEPEHGVPGSSIQLKRVARRIMWYPLCEERFSLFPNIHIDWPFHSPMLVFCTCTVPQYTPW